MASGLRPATLSPSSGSLSLRLRDSHPLASPRNATRRFILQKTRRKRYTPATSCRSTVSGSVSLPSPGFFSPFPHGTPALSVAVLYSALDRGRPGFGQGSSCPALLRYRIMEAPRIHVRDSHPLRSGCPAGSASLTLDSLHGSSPCGPTTPLWAVWAPPRSLAATCGISVDFLSPVT